MMAKLEAGTTLVCDRYAFSGVAFTSAKPGFDLDWCKQPDAGIPVPDLLLHLELPASEAEARGGFGEERYEVSEFQATVKQQFQKMYETLDAVTPTIIDVSGKSIDGLGAEIEKMVLEKLAADGDRDSATKVLW